MWEEFRQDGRLALRTFARRPSFFLIAVATISVGVGAVTTIFTVIDGVILTPLPYPAADRIVRVGQVSEEPGRIYAMSYLDFKDIQAGNSSFEALAAARTTGVTVLGDGPPENYLGAFVSPEFFAALGIDAAVGRVFDRSEDEAEAAVVVLGHELWQRRWGGDIGLVGRTIDLGGGQFTVVGVMPEGFLPPEAMGQGTAELWIPLTLVDREARESRGDTFLMGIGRLAEGVSPSVASAELDVLGGQLQRAFPAESFDHEFGLAPLHAQTIGSVSGTLGPLFGAVALLLVIACANVANLFLVRASERGREFALRTAMGANRGRLVRQVLTEGLVLSLFGWGVGVAIAWVGVEAFVLTNPGDLPRLSEVAIDRRVVAFALVVSVCASGAFGLLPALRSARSDLVAGLRAGARGVVGARNDERIRAGVVVGEISLALVLVIGAGLLFNSFVRLNRVDLGLDPTNVYSVSVTYPDAESPEQVTAFFEELLASVSAIPGVSNAGATAILPVSGGYMYQSLAFDGRPTADDERYPVKYQEVTPGYFEAMSIPLRAGREFAAGDNSSSELVAIVSETMAREVFGTTNPVGHTFTLGDNGLRDGTFQIVGVSGDTRLRSVSEGPEAELYLAFAQNPRPRMSVVAKASSSDPAVLTAMRDRVWALRSDIPVRRQVVLSEFFATSISPARFYTLLLSGFAGMALLLALIGIYGTLAYSVAQRAHEVGVRMALGASAIEVHRMVLLRGLSLAALGALVGVGVALPLSGLLESFVFGVAPTDPATIMVAVASVVGTCVVASIVPARRATRLDPVVVLRGE